MVRPLRTLRVVAAIVGVIAAHPALAAPCSGFTDVDDTSTFCPNVDWLKNRAITLGCTSSTAYCPGSVVNRLAMAAFMNRLGVALTPAIVYNEASGAAFDLDLPPAAVCPTASIASATYPRAAHAGAVLTAQFAPVASTVALTIVQSIDNGATWTPMNAIPASFGGTNQWGNAAVYKGDLPLAPLIAYRFGLRVERAAGGGTGDLSNWNCQVSVMVTSRTGTASPF